jgi:hypothetical protein
LILVFSSFSESFMSEHIPLQPVPRVTSGMAITSLVLGCSTFFFWILTGIPAVILGIVALVRINRSHGQLKGDGLAIGGIVTGAVGSLFILPVMLALLLPAVQAAREAARRSVSMNNLRQQAIALQNFADTNGGVLPAAKNEGGSQLSWRVHILPYLEQQELYSKFRLDEPWDSDHNKTLIAQIPEAFKVPGGDFAEGETGYLAVTGEGAAFGDGSSGISLRDFSDGTSRTILVVETDQGVPWTKPDDYPFDSLNPGQGLGGVRRGGFLAMMGDASIIFISDREPPENLGSLMTRNGGEEWVEPR